MESRITFRIHWRNFRSNHIWLDFYERRWTIYSIIYFAMRPLFHIQQNVRKFCQRGWWFFQRNGEEGVDSKTDWIPDGYKRVCVHVTKAYAILVASITDQFGHFIFQIFSRIKRCLQPILWYNAHLEYSWFGVPFLPSRNGSDDTLN